MPTNTNTTDVAIDIDLSAIAAAADPAEEEDIEAINGARARQGTAFIIKSGVVVVCVALGTLIGVGSFRLDGPPTRNVSSSKQVAITITSGEITIDGFTKKGDGNCLDGAGQRYDYVKYENVANAEACAEKCLDCPGGGQPDISGVKKLLLRGFRYGLAKGTLVCDCYIENSAGFPPGLCGDIPTEDLSRDGTGEIKKTTAVGFGGCWKVNSKSSKSPKNSKSPKRG